MSTKDDTNALHPEGASAGIDSGSGDDNKTLFARVYQRWRTPLMRMLTRRLGNPHDAKEAVHDVFTRYIAAGKILPPEEQGPYLYQMAIHLTHDIWHKSRYQRNVGIVSLEEHTDMLEQLPAAGDSDPASMMDHRERLHRLEAAMAELPERQREVLVLHSIDGLTQTEIARRLGISRRMVYTHLTRALAYCELRVKYNSAKEMELMHHLHTDTE